MLPCAQLPSIYVALTAQIRNVLRGKDIVLVYDGWCDRYGKRSYLGIVARYVDTDAKQIKHIILAVKDLLHPHTSDNIFACLMDVLQDFEVERKQVKCSIAKITINATAVDQVGRRQRRECSKMFH